MPTNRHEYGRVFYEWICINVLPSLSSHCIRYPGAEVLLLRTRVKCQFAEVNSVKGIYSETIEMHWTSDSSKIICSFILANSFFHVHFIDYNRCWRTVKECVVPIQTTRVVEWKTDISRKNNTFNFFLFFAHPMLRFVNEHFLPLNLCGLRFKGLLVYNDV